MYIFYVTVMNISTSSQVCYPVLSSGFVPPRFETPTAVSYFPFFNEQFLAVAASLNGGNSLSAFVKMLQTWFSTFGKLGGLLCPYQQSCEGDTGIGRREGLNNLSLLW